MNTMEAMRTNYFHVRDPEAFLEFMNRVICDEDQIEVWHRIDDDGEPIFGFGAYGTILGIVDADGMIYEDDAYDDFIAGLQDHVADDDAIIMMHSGFQQLRDVFGYADIITSTDTDYIDLQDMASDQAMSMIEKRYEHKEHERM